MSLLITIDTDPDFAPKEALPAAERLISGNPSYPAFLGCSRCRMKCKPDFGILSKGMVGVSGASDGRCGG
jgi:hypothetical protein